MSPPRTTPPQWSPTRIRRVVKTYDTSMGTTRVQTDAGTAYLKALGNRQGPHCLACELVATRLAEWFGLSVAEHIIFDLPADSCIDLPRSARTQPGPAFLSRHVPGRTWGGLVEDLPELANPLDVTRLVVFDTWVLNCDRHPPDTSRKPNYENVYLAAVEGVARWRLMAIDHTHCFNRGGDLTPTLANIDRVQDEATYGLFPRFAARIRPMVVAWCASQLRGLSADVVRGIVRDIPPQWDVSDAARDALTELILRRAAYLAGRIETGWIPALEPPVGSSTP